MIVNTIAGLYWRIEGYSSTIEAPNVSIHPMTVETDTKIRYDSGSALLLIFHQERKIIQNFFLVRR